MTYHKCRFCNLWESADFVKYGPRHYAHLRCLHHAYTPDAFEALLNKIPVWQLKNISFREVEELGLRELLMRIIAERERP